MRNHAVETGSLIVDSGSRVSSTGLRLEVIAMGGACIAALGTTRAQVRAGMMRCACALLATGIR